MLSAVEANRINPKMVAGTAVAGAAVGAGAAYLIQQHAIKTVEREANKSFLMKVAEKIKNGIVNITIKAFTGMVKLKKQLSEKLVDIGKSDKISKSGIAKTAAVSGVALPLIYCAGKLLKGNKE